MPQRIQRRRTKGWRMPAAAVYVGRPTKWGNPWSPENAWHVTLARGFKFSVESSRPMTAAECVKAFRDSIKRREFGYGASELREALRGRDLACWCRPGEPCHADVLLELANR